MTSSRSKFSGSVSLWSPLSSDFGSARLVTSLSPSGFLGNPRSSRNWPLNRNRVLPAVSQCCYSRSNRCRQTSSLSYRPHLLQLSNIGRSRSGIRSYRKNLRSQSGRGPSYGCCHSNFSRLNGNSRSYLNYRRYMRPCRVQFCRNSIILGFRSYSSLMNRYMTSTQKSLVRLPIYSYSGNRSGRISCRRSHSRSTSCSIGRRRSNKRSSMRHLFGSQVLPSIGSHYHGNSGSLGERRLSLSNRRVRRSDSRSRRRLHRRYQNA